VVRRKEREDAFHRYLRKWRKEHAYVGLWLKREEYESLKKLADSMNMTIQSFLVSIAKGVIDIGKVKSELESKLKSYEKDIQLIDQLKKDLFNCRNQLKSMELTISKYREYEKRCNEYAEYLKECNSYVESCKNLENNYKELEMRLRGLNSKNRMLSDKLGEVVGMLNSVIERLCYYEEKYVSWYSRECKQWKDKLDKLKEELHSYL